MRLITNDSAFAYRIRLFGYSLLLSIVPVLVTGLLTAHMYSKGIREEVFDNQQMTLKQLKYQVETFLYNIERSSLQIANDPTIGKSLRVGVSMTDPVALETTMETIDRIHNYRSYADIAYNLSLVYSNYDYVYTNRNGIIPISDFPYRQLLSKDPPPQNGSRIIPPNLYRDQPNLLLIRSVRTSAAPAEGFLLMEIEAKRFYDFFRSLEPNNRSQFLIADNEDRIVMSEKPSEIGSKVNSWSDLRIDRLDADSVPDTIRIAGTDYQVSLLTSESNGWRYIAITPYAAVMEKIDKINRLTWGITAILFLLWITFSLLGTRKLSFPVLQIVKKLPSSKQSKDVFTSIGTYIDQTTETNRLLIDQVHIQQPGFRENLLLQLLHGDISDQEFLNRTEPSDLPFDQPWHCICVAEIDDFIGFKHKYGNGDRTLMMYAWPKLMREVCEERYACMTVGSRPGQITFILGMRASDSETELHIRMLCDRIRERIRQYLKFTVSIAVGKPSSSLNTISKEFDEALRTLHYRYWLGKDATITRADLLTSDSFRETSRLIVRYEKVTVNAIAQGDFDQAEQAVKELFGSIPITGPPSAIGYFSHLIGAIDHLMEEMKGVNPVFDYNLYEKWNTFETVSEAASWFHAEYFPSLRSYFGEQTVWQRKQTVQQVIHFIHEQFETDVSLQLLADRFGLPTYQLSRMFKEETGSSFLDYLIEYRISKAKEWLVHSDIPIKEMTERLCYATTQNFTRVFKQMTGVPPGKYRDDYRRSRDGGKSGPI